MAHRLGWRAALTLQPGGGVGNERASADGCHIHVACFAATMVLQTFDRRSVQPGNFLQQFTMDHWVRLRADEFSISATCAEPISDWNWLTNYLQLDLDLSLVLLKFPDDEPMRAAVTACRGLRLLRQQPWECLASFILSSTKQIVQIQQIIRLLCERFGEPVSAGPNYGPAYAFPSPARVARCTEADLRACKMSWFTAHGNEGL